MNDEIIVFDNIIDVEYQEKIKNILLDIKKEITLLKILPLISKVIH